MPTITLKQLLILLLLILPVYLNAQENSLSEGESSSSSDAFGGDPFGGDPFGGLGDSLPPPVIETPETPSATTETQSAGQSTQESDEVPATPDGSVSGTESTLPANSYETEAAGSTGGSAELNAEVSSSDEYDDPEMQSMVQNAVIEGIQITTDKGELPDEKIISGYFIFRDKPSSYFYEVKLKEKKLIFEFNDTKTGASPVPNVSEMPIKGFTIERGKLDVNKDVKGLKPEWHDLIRVIFDLEDVPDVHVNDEYSIITFSFKWTTDPLKKEKYIVKDNSKKIVLWSSAGVGVAAAGVITYFLLKPGPGPTELKPLPTDDLPDRGNP